MSLLLHICCAPCSVMCVESLRDEGIEPVGYWYSPNIHPFTEYAARRDTLKSYADGIGLETVFEDEYGLRRFLSEVGDYDRRCGKCYEMRLDRAAEYAAAHGFSAFSSTLLISPYQNHELIRAVGEKCADRHGVEFLYRDFRPRFAEGQLKARELGLYMQKYCGCVFSEESRYLDPAPSLAGKLPEGCEFPSRRLMKVKRLQSVSELAALPGGNRFAGLPEGSDVFVLQVGEGLTPSAAAVVSTAGGEPELLALAKLDGCVGKGCEENLLKQLCGNYGQKYRRMIAGVSAADVPFYVKQGFDRYEKTVKGKADGGDLHYYSKDLKAGRGSFGVRV